jgi:hypothetical protein
LLAVHQSLNPRDFVVIDILKFFFWNSSLAHSPVVVMMTELGKLFPSIPLVAEEDSSFLRSNNLEDSVVSAVSDKAGVEDKPWARDDVLKAIDRGAKEAFLFGTKPATYWVGVTELFHCLEWSLYCVLVLIHVYVDGPHGLQTACSIKGVDYPLFLIKKEFSF